MHRRPLILAGAIALRLFRVPQIARAGALLAAFSGAQVHAQDTATWTGGGGDGNWTTSANWSAGFVPNGNDLINFAGNTNLTTTMDLTGGALSQYRLFFNAGAGAFTLNGAGTMSFFDFGGAAPKIENNSTNTQTINFATALNGTGSGGAAEINPADGDLVFGGTVDLAGTTQLRVFGNNGKTVTFGGAISSSGNGGANSVSINQNSTVIFGAANTYTGDTFINAGTLQFNAGASAAGSILRLGDTTGAAAATLAVASGATINSTVVVRAGSSGTKTISGLATSGTGTLSGGVFLDADATASSANGGTLAFTGSVFDLKNQTLTVGGGGATTIAGVLQNSTGSGKLTKTGSGTVTLTGANTYTGATTISAGVVNIQHASALGTVAAGTSVTAGAALQIQGGITTLAEALTLNGTGIATDGALRNISGNNSYAGLVTLGSATRINSDAGTLTLSNAGTITGATFGLTVGGAGNSTINSIIGNTTGGLTKDGAGTLTLGGNNTFSGATTISAGTLRIAAAERLANTTDVTIAGGAVFNLNGFSETFDALAGAGTVTSSAAGTVTLTVGSSNTVGGATFSGIVQNGSGTVQLDKIGTGTQTLTGASTFTGRTYAQTGILSVDALADGGVASPIGASSTAATNLQIGTLTATGTLRYTGSGHSTDRLFRVVGSTGVLESSGTGPLNFTNTGSLIVSGGTFQNFVLGGTNTGSNTFAPAIPNPPTHSTGLTKTGAGTWIVTGNSTFTGATALDDGILESATLTNAGVSGPLGAGGAFDFQGGTLRYTGAGHSTNRQLTPFTGGTIDSAGAGPIHFTSTAAPFVPAGTYTLTLTGTNSGGANTFALPMPGATGTVSLVKSGPNAWKLTGTSSYGGTTTVRAGTLLVGTNAPSGAAGALGNTTSAVLVGDTSGAADAALLTDGAFTVGRILTIRSGNTGVITLGGNSAAASVFSGAINLGTANGTAKGATLVALSGGSVDFQGIINENTSVPASNITIGDATHLGTVKLSNAASAYSGITTINSGATLEATKLSAGGSNSSIGNSAGAATSLIINGGTLKYTGTGDSTNRLFTFDANGATIDASASANGALSFTGTGSLVASGTGDRTLTLTGTSTGANSIASIIANPSTDTTALAKTGAGTWRLTGANTFTGATTVSAGTLEAAAGGALGATSGIIMNTGGTLLLSNAGTTDRINNSATITMAGGTIAFTGSVAEGSSPGTGALTLTANSVINFAGGNDIINFGASHLATWTIGTTLSIWNWAGSITGGGNDRLKFGLDSTALTASQLAQISFYSDSGSTFLGIGGFVGSLGEVVPVPEPSSVFVGLAMFGLAAWRERRRARAVACAHRSA